MTRRTAYIISALAIICGLTYSAIDMYRMANNPTSQTLRANGINPWTGGSLD